MTQEEYRNQPCGVAYPIVAIHWFDGGGQNYVDYVKLTDRIYSTENIKEAYDSARYYGAYLRDSYATIDYVEIVPDVPKDVVVTNVTEGRSY